MGIRDKSDTIISLLTIMLGCFILGVVVNKITTPKIECEFVEDYGDYYSCFVKIKED